MPTKKHVKKPKVAGSSSEAKSSGTGAYNQRGHETSNHRDEIDRPMKSDSAWADQGPDDDYRNFGYEGSPERSNEDRDYRDRNSGAQELTTRTYGGPDEAEHESETVSEKSALRCEHPQERSQKQARSRAPTDPRS